MKTVLFFGKDESLSSMISSLKERGIEGITRLVESGTGTEVEVEEAK